MRPSIAPTQIRLPPVPGVTIPVAGAVTAVTDPARSVRLSCPTMALTLSDLFHVSAATAYFAWFSVDKMQTWCTYGYCRHLDRVGALASRYRRHLAEHPEVAARLARPLPFLDVAPAWLGQPARPGTVGEAYARMLARYAEKGYPDLRDYRLEHAPEERVGLDLNFPGDRQRWLVHRRNLFMTASHDLCHLITGGNDEPEGEALVALYQYHALRVPQNLVTALGAFGWLAARRRRASTANIRRSWALIRRTRSYLELDLDAVGAMTLSEVRHRLALPDRGLM